MIDEQGIRKANKGLSLTRNALMAEEADLAFIAILKALRERWRGIVG